MHPVPKTWDNRPRFDHLPPKSQLPTMYDLPSETPEDPGLPDEFHILQPRLLSETFQPDPALSPAWMTASDLNLYYDPANVTWYKRPDWFAVLGVAQADEVAKLRLSYVIWQEEIAPYLLVELLSPGTERDDLGTRLRDTQEPPAKWDVYERYLQVPYYAVYSRYTGELKLFGLVAGRYRPLAQTAAPQSAREGLWLPEAGIGLGLWEGTYGGVQGRWLRFFDPQGQWLPSLEDRLQIQTVRAEQERQRAEQERQRAEQERQRAEGLAAQLRALGIEPAP
jgi:Uma2 family endonuclease